jgi:predicted AlkP superfamily pyrophosphatase or phosphodiesterase
MLFRDTKAIPFRGLQDLFVSLEELATANLTEKRFIYAYWSDLDELQHVYSSSDIRVKQEYRDIQHAFCRFIGHLRKNASDDTLILLTADHGQVITEISNRQVVQKYPDLVANLHMLPTGESRLPYLHVRPGMESSVRELIEKFWPGEFWVVDSELAVSSGLFGPEPYHPEIISRVVTWYSSR